MYSHEVVCFLYDAYFDAILRGSSRLMNDTKPDITWPRLTLHTFSLSFCGMSFTYTNKVLINQQATNKTVFNTKAKAFKLFTLSKSSTETWK